MRRILGIFGVLLALLIASCGGTNAPIPTPTPQHVSIGQRCLRDPHGSGQSFTGCSLSPKPFGQQVQAMQRAQQRKLGVAGSSPQTLALLSAHGLFPDVSLWQGRVDWNAVKAWQLAHGWIPAAIFKIGEFGTDPWASTNAQVTAALGFWRAGYWFVRNTGCSSEANQIIGAARQFNLKVVFLDLEVPEAAGYGICLSPPLKRAGLVVGEYTAPGTNPGGVDTSDPLWEATYGSSFSPIWQPVVAWQCTDGQFGCVTFIPGIGTDDVSLNLGVTNLGAAPPPPPDPYRIFPHITFWFVHHRVPVVEYTLERLWVKGHGGFGCSNPVRRPVCKALHFDLQLETARLAYLVAHHSGTWHTAHRDLREHAMIQEKYNKRPTPYGANLPK